MAAPEIAAEHFSVDTQEFIELLNQKGVRYLIVGGEAVILYGHVRLTGDVDFFYSLDQENLGHLLMPSSNSGMGSFRALPRLLTWGFKVR